MKAFFFHWHFDVVTVVLIAAIVILYEYVADFAWTRQCNYFVAGLFVLIAAVFSPLHWLGMHYLFSAHMISHILLLLVVPPLLVAGIPQSNRIQKSVLRISVQLKRFPIACWLAGVVVMWLWHIPVVFHQMFSMKENMQQDNSMGILFYLHLLSLLTAGTLFCWPILNPYKQTRLYAPNAVLYLVSACIACSLLGLLITFAPVGLYTGYLLESKNLIAFRLRYGITATMDQQAAGLIMWVPCCFIYLSASVLLLHKWFTAKDNNNLSLTDNSIIQ